MATLPAGIGNGGCWASKGYKAKREENQRPTEGDINLRGKSTAMPYFLLSPPKRGEAFCSSLSMGAGLPNDSEALHTPWCLLSSPISKRNNCVARSLLLAFCRMFSSRLFRMDQVGAAARARLSSLLSTHQQSLTGGILRTQLRIASKRTTT